MKKTIVSTKRLMILAVMMVMTISARSAMPLGSSKNAMSYNAAKHEALFLSLSLPYQFNGLLARQMLNVETNHQHTGKAAFYFLLQTFIIVRIVAVA